MTVEELSAESSGDRNDRTRRVLAESGVNRLLEASVAVVGCGGIGSMVAEQLARIGVGGLVLIDPDVVEESNLPRLAGAIPEHVGTSKVAVLEQHLRLACPGTEVVALAERVQDAADRLEDVDVVVAGLDRVSPRLFLNQYAIEQSVPYIDAGCVINTVNESVESMRGYIQIVDPGESACLDCIDRLDIDLARLEQMSEDEVRGQIQQGYVPEDVLEPEPSISFLNGVVASIAVNKAIRLLTGKEPGAGLIRYDGLQEGLSAMETSPSDSCPSCNHGRSECPTPNWS